MARKQLDSVFQYARKLAVLQTCGAVEDHELLERFVGAKDEAAFAALVERHGAMVLGVCRRALRNEDDAEDACQATFLVMARRAATIRQKTAVGCWLHGVASRVAGNVRRDRARRVRRERESPTAVASEPPAEISWREVQAALDEELLRLPERLRAPLILCYLEGRTRDEAARLLRLGVGCLHGRLERGRKLLCDHLTRRGLALSTALLAVALGENVARAGLPPSLNVAMINAAAFFAPGQTSAANSVSANVLALAREAMRPMVLTNRIPVVVMASLAGLLLAAGSATFTAAGPKQDSKATPEKLARKGVPRVEDAKALQGAWLAVEAEFDGRKVTSDEVTDLRLVFHGEEIALGAADGKGRTRKLNFTLDPAKSPKEINLTSLDGQEKDKSTPGIYSLEKGQLRLCYFRDGTARPKDFKTSQGDGKLVLVLERDGGNGAKPANAKRPGDEADSELKAILREWQLVQQEFWEAYDMAKTPELRRGLMTAKQTKVRPIAERCLKLAATYPDRPTALTALFWAAGNASSTNAGKQAVSLLLDGRVARTDPEDLFRAINMAGPYSAELPSLAPAVLECVKKKLDHPRAARLLTWVCSSYFRQDPKHVPPPFGEAAELIVSRFADSPDIHNFCETLAPLTGTPPPWAREYERALRTILEKNRHRLVRVTAQFALASVVKSAGEARQEEAVRLFEQLLKEFDGSDPTLGVEKQFLRVALAELEEIRFRAVGRPVPEIDGEDLVGRPMKLSQFRGKVVLLSFWATWCFPCMKLITHERALVKRLEGKPFALVGVNSDSEAEVLKDALKTHEISWRSFRDRRSGKPAISDEWKILGYPTLYLIDHQGIIRHRWIGAPPPEELNRAVDRLVGAVSD
jgi:RNA polymerase sigma-70 factor (ECF subfamily)